MTSEATRSRHFLASFLLKCIIKEASDTGEHLLGQGHIPLPVSLLSLPRCFPFLTPLPPPFGTFVILSRVLLTLSLVRALDS